MNVGLAGTYIEPEDVDVLAFDMSAKSPLLDENKPTILDAINQSALMRCSLLILHWIPGAHGICSKALVIPRTVQRLNTLLHTIQLSIQPNKILPLATSSKNEAVMTELNDVLAVDSAGQIGQSVEEFQKQLSLVIGDILTCEKIIQLKKYCNTTDEFQRFEILEPVLAIFMLATRPSKAH
jgi:hypothetical protein